MVHGMEGPACLSTARAAGGAFLAGMLVILARGYVRKQLKTFLIA